ncbi:MAG TPA: ABC transporter substrate-binding protein, partial [Thermomicrobiales bacterium]|nr:ABC transporter substrate-binding protein [Thermomicrobiales bacterium]
MNQPKRSLRIIALLLTAILLMSLVTACGDDDEDEPTATAATGTDAPATVAASPEVSPEASPTTAGTGEMTGILLALDWYPWGNHTGIFMAIENGYFEEEGLDVEVNVPADPTTALQLVATGNDDFTISYQADVLYARSQGLG